MAWNISAGAIRNPIPPILLILALVFAGWTAYGRLPINQLPNVDFGGFTVTVAQARRRAGGNGNADHAAHRIGADIGRRRASASPPRFRPAFPRPRWRWKATAICGRAVDDARDAINRIRSELPADITEPVITRMDAASQPIGYYAVEGEGMSPAGYLLVHRQRSAARICSRCLASAQCSASAASIAKSASNSIPRACSLMASPPTRSTTSCARSTSICPAAKHAWADKRNRSARWAARRRSKQLADTRIVGAGRAQRSPGRSGHDHRRASDLNSISRYNGQPVVGFMVHARARRI